MHLGGLPLEPVFELLQWLSFQEAGTTSMMTDCSGLCPVQTPPPTTSRRRPAARRPLLRHQRPPLRLATVFPLPLSYLTMGSCIG
jgi:hypothetical protein